MADSRKCSPQQIEQIVKHLTGAVRTIQEQQGLDITLTNWTWCESDDPRTAPPALVITFNASFYHPVPLDDDIPF